MFEILVIFHIISALIIIALILLQQGKGAQTGAAFGSGASTTVFGSQGAGNFLSRTTAILVALFFIINLSLANLTNRATKAQAILDLGPASVLEIPDGAVKAAEPAPAVPPAQPQPQSDVPG